MFEIDIEAVEPRGRREARDLGAADEPHRHRGDDFATRKFVLDVIAQDRTNFARH